MKPSKSMPTVGNCRLQITQLCTVPFKQAPHPINSSECWIPQKDREYARTGKQQPKYSIQCQYIKINSHAMVIFKMKDDNDISCNHTSDFSNLYSGQLVIVVCITMLNHGTVGLSSNLFMFYGYCRPCSYITRLFESMTVLY